MHRLLLALVLVLAAWPAMPARAEDPPPTEAERAKTLFRQGAELARQYRWSEAIRALEEAARLRPHARTSYNLGYCERGLERFTRARRWFRDAIRRDVENQQGELNADQRRAAETYLAEVEARMAHLKVEVPPGDLLLAVDDRPLEIERPELAVAGTRAHGPGEPPPARRFEILVDPGRHEIVISSKGGRSHRVETTVSEGAVNVLRLQLPRAAPRKKPPRPKPARSADAGLEDNRPLVGPAVLTAFGAAAAVVGTAFAVKAAVTFAEAEDACPQSPLCRTDRASDLSRQADRFGNLATAALVIAGASTVGAVVLWIATPSKPRAGSLIVRARY